MNGYIVLGDTRDEAQRLWDHCVVTHGDGVAADNFLNGMGLDSQSLPPDVLATIKADMIAGYGGFRMVGTKEQVVDDMKMLSDAGIDGMLLTWPAFIDGMAQFQREVYPLLAQAGIR
jgi:alkanesulfonate monooxygenase SsuD/methylene tetrahydromethanopterin reductase-like flavin-dependent oxidoreductase (luciferase family)